MQSFIEMAKTYARFHQNKFTLYTHFVGVTLIVFSTLLFFSFLHLAVPGYFSRTAAELLALLLFIYYLLLNWRLALSFAPFLIILLWIANWIGGEGPTASALTVFFTCFILGWAIQLIAHFLEGSRPALTSNLWQAIIAPLVLTAEAYFLFGKMQDLQAEIHVSEQTKSEK